MYKIVSLILFVFCQSVYAQNREYVVPFKKEQVQKRLSGAVSTQREEIQGQIVGIPDTLSTFCGLYSITIDSNISIPKDSVGYEYYKRNKVYVFVALNEEKGEKYVIVDSNTNYDFSDDKLYVFSLDDIEKDYQDLIISIETVHYTKEGSFPISINLVLEPFDKTGVKRMFFDKNRPEREFLLEVFFSSNYHLYGNYIINDYHVDFIALPRIRDSLLPLDLNKRCRLSFEVPDDPAYYQLPMGVRIGDTVSIADRTVLFEKIHQNHLYLKDLGVSKDSSGVTKFLPALYGYELENKHEIHLNELTKNKYVFIDFWGSWCKPCIESLPKLVELYEKVKDRDDILVVGLALDYEGDLDKLKNIIDSQNLGWLNLWVKREDSSLPSNAFKKMNVYAFPTYMIVDKSGQIRYRNISSFNVEEAISFFLELIDGE